MPQTNFSFIFSFFANCFILFGVGGFFRRLVRTHFILRRYHGNWIQGHWIWKVISLSFTDSSYLKLFLLNIIFYLLEFIHWHTLLSKMSKKLHLTITPREKWRERESVIKHVPYSFGSKFPPKTERTTYCHDIYSFLNLWWTRQFPAYNWDLF